MRAYEVYTGLGRSTAKRSGRELFKLPAVPPPTRGPIDGFPSCDYMGVDLQWTQGAGLLAECGGVVVRAGAAGDGACRGSMRA